MKEGDVVEVVTDMTMAFKPLVENEETIKLQIKRLQNANKKIFLSIGGGNAFISLLHTI